MLSQKGDGGKREEMVAVAIDRDKGSQFVLRWAIDNILGKGETVTLLHVKQRPSFGSNSVGSNASLSDADCQAKDLFLPFRCYCTRKDIKCNEVVLEDTEIPRALCDYVRLNLVEVLIVGAPSKNSFVRFKSDVSTSVSKAAPEFCTVYIISKGKISSVRSASRPVPTIPLRNQLQSQNNNFPNMNDALPMQATAQKAERTQFRPHNLIEDMEIKSPFNSIRISNKSQRELSSSDNLSDISFVSSGRPSIYRMFPSFLDSQDVGMAPPVSSSSETDGRSFGSPYSGFRSPDLNAMYGSPSSSLDSQNMSWSSSQNLEDMEAEMKRLKQELKQTMDMYSTACREALMAKQKAMELQRWKIEEQQRIAEARLAKEAALAIAEKEKAKSKAAIEAAEAAQRIAELETQKRINAEAKARKEAKEKKKVLDVLAHSDLRYRKYTIEEIEAATENFAESRKIGEGGYGPVYKCNLDHTQVAIKVLRPDAAQGRSQFQQEVEVLSCIRHPNMVLLLGACPEYGCLVYEYMANGSLDDCLFQRGNSPGLPWQIRFRIAAEIGTGLLFLHQTKPEPLVHRDLKPANILLDRNFVSKISDVGLARLVPPSVADTVTQYRMTSTAGTFCYIDPEYQQTGMLGIKSDIYSLGILLLQIVTAKPPMGLTHHVERAIERGTFANMLDPTVPDWPIEEALRFAKLSLKCAELRRKDRPDLGTIILPELNMLRALAEESMSSITKMRTGPEISPSQSQVIKSQEILSDPHLQHSGYGSSRSHSST